MKTTRFEAGEKITYKGADLEIVSSNKNFLTRVISYRLSDDSVVSEDDLVNGIAQKEAKQPEQPKKEQEPAQTNAPAPVVEKEMTLTEVKALYKQVIGKNPPPAKQKDVAFMQKVIKEAQQPVNSAYEALAQLDTAGLTAFITEKGLDIDAEDYTQPGELLKAVCEELNVQIPA